MAFPALASRIEGEAIALATFVPLEEGTVLELTVSFPDDEPFRVEAVVDRARDDEGSVLVVVTSADERARTRLARFTHEAETRPDVNVA